MDIFQELVKISSSGFHLLLELFTNKSNWLVLVGLIVTVYIYRLTYSFLKTIISIVIFAFILYYIIKNLGYPVPSILKIANLFIYMFNVILNIFGINYQMPFVTY